MMEPMRELLYKAVALRVVMRRVECGRGERRVRVQVEVRMCICVFVSVRFFCAEGRGLGDGDGGIETYGCVVDETWRWRSVIWGVGIVVIIVVIAIAIIIIVPMVRIPRRTEFRSWYLDMK